MRGLQAGEADSDAAQRALDAMRSGSVSDRGSRQSLSNLITQTTALVQPTSTKIALVIAGVILTALLSAVWFVSRSPFAEVQSTSPATIAAPAPTTTTTGPGVVVDVGGAVRQPGVYRLSLGSRVVDALEAAGGPSDSIDLDQINLAATVTDGQRVWITRRGELPPVAATAPAGSSGGSSNSGPLDLNSATIEQLDALTGIGPATAKAIIDRRTELGRFRSVDDLLTVKGIGSSKLDSIRSSVVVR